MLLLSQALLAVGTMHPRVQDQAPDQQQALFCFQVCVWLKATMDVAVVSAELRREEREP